jgi:hypothetical protein
MRSRGQAGEMAGSIKASPRQVEQARRTILDTAKVINKLNEIVRWEWTGVVPYTQPNFLFQDLWREVDAA